MSKIVICDIDGVLALPHPENPRGYFEWDRVQEDVPNEPMFAVLAGFILLGYEVLFVTGRSDVCEDDTVEWVLNHLVQVPLINLLTELSLELNISMLMRKDGDRREDTIVKKELYEEIVKEGHEVILAIDDRPRVLKMWQELGIPILAVGDPWKDF